MPKKKSIWTLVPEENCELEEPYECPNCKGHVMLDSSFLDQVSEETTCPYCRKVLELEE